MRRAVAAFALMMVWAGPQAVAAEPVQVATSDGATLAGNFRDAGRDAPGVLFFPMCDGDPMAGWAPIAERLLAARVSSLVIAYRGTGGGRPGGSGDHRTADADTAFAWLRGRVGVPLAVAGSSCGVYFSLLTAMRHAESVRAVVALTGPHLPEHVEHVRRTPGLAVLSGSAIDNKPAPDWARELNAASPHRDSRLAIATGGAHGTDIFTGDPAFADEIARWLVARLRVAAGPID